MSPWTVVIADDDPLFSRGLMAVIDGDDRLTVIGTARDGREATALAAALRPDIVTMDLDMPVLDGVEGTRAVVALGIAVVVVTGSDSPERVAAASAAGAVASVDKVDAFGLLPELLTTVLAFAPR